MNEAEAQRVHRIIRAIDNCKRISPDNYYWQSSEVILAELEAERLEEREACAEYLDKRGEEWKKGGLAKSMSSGQATTVTFAGINLLNRAKDIRAGRHRGQEEASNDRPRVKDLVWRNKAAKRAEAEAKVGRRQRTNILGGDGFDDAAWVSDQSDAKRQRSDRLDTIIADVEQCSKKYNEPSDEFMCECEEKIAAELDAERAEAKEECAKIADKYAKSSISAERIAMEIRKRGGKDGS